MLDRMFQALLTEAGLVAALEFVVVVGLWNMLRWERKQSVDNRRDTVAALSKLGDSINGLSNLIHNLIGRLE